MVTGKKRLIALAFVAVIVFWAAPPATTQQRTAAAQRIVSLVPALTEMLFAIGAGPQVVAVSSYDEFPPEVKSLPKVGALLDPDMERILALRPDLVVSYGSQTDMQAQLARAKIRVFSYRHAGLNGVFTTLKDLGDTVGRTTDSERLSREIRSGLDAIQALVRGRPKPRTLLVFERDPESLRGVYVSGGVGFLHDMLGIAGGVNVFADVARESVQPSVLQGLAVIVEPGDDAGASAGVHPRSARDGTARRGGRHAGEARVGRSRVCSSRAAGPHPDPHRRSSGGTGSAPRSGD